MSEGNIVLLMLLALTFKHFVADFLYQPPYQWMNKGTYGHGGGIMHSLQHSLLTVAALVCFDVSAATLTVIAVVEFLIHYHVDWAKMNINKKKGWGATTHNEFWILLGVDQLLHGLTYLAIVWYAIAYK